jgi:hypothetical protein
MDDIVLNLSNNFTEIILRDKLRDFKDLNWGDNGIGDRWANKKYNYTFIHHNGKIKTYSENNDDFICPNILKDFLDKYKHTYNKGIIGIFIHSKRTNIIKRPIREDIKKFFKNKNCVSCGSSTDLICDHKNDMYNDNDVLNIKTQKIEDFQSLCNHCNLQKRQVFKKEKELNKIYSAKNLDKFKVFPFEFPWEKKHFNITDINSKVDTYWYDPIEFNNKIFLYNSYKLPIIYAIKNYFNNKFKYKDIEILDFGKLTI